MGISKYLEAARFQAHGCQRKWVCNELGYAIFPRESCTSNEPCNRVNQVNIPYELATVCVPYHSFHDGREGSDRVLPILTLSDVSILIRLIDRTRIFFFLKPHWYFDIMQCFSKE